MASGCFLSLTLSSCDLDVADSYQPLFEICDFVAVHMKFFLCTWASIVEAQPKCYEYSFIDVMNRLLFPFKSFASKLPLLEQRKDVLNAFCCMVGHG